MAKPKHDEKTDQPTELSRGDQGRKAQRAAFAAREVYEAKARTANSRGSEVARKLIDEKGGAPIVLDGVAFQPKKGASRKQADGSVKAPEWPYQLVRKGHKEAVEV